MDLRVSRILLCCLLLLSSGCGKKLLPFQPPLETSVEMLDRRAAEPEHGRRKGAAQIIGRKDGAFFALYRPDHWNRTLVVYVHGFTPPSAPIALPSADFIEPFRDLLLSRGYAVAYSSWSENGFAVKSAIRHSNLVRELFDERLGRPRHTFLVGQSLGGLAAIALAEKFPDDFSGALVTSPVSGGSLREVAYIANVRVLFDYFYPGVLPGDLLHLPEGLDVNRDIVGPALAAIRADPRGVGAMSQIKEVPLPFRNSDELVSSILQALGYHGVELHDLLARTNGGSFFDNMRTAYTSETLPAPLLADLNSRVARHRVSRDGADFLRSYYEPTGELEIPILALHNNFDPVVPVFHAARYRERVERQGNSRLLEQRFFGRFGHTGFSPAEMASAFEDLVRRATKHKRSHDDDDRIAAFDRANDAAALGGSGSVALEP